MSVGNIFRIVAAQPSTSSDFRKAVNRTFGTRSSEPEKQVSKEEPILKTTDDKKRKRRVTRTILATDGSSNANQRSAKNE